MIKRPEAQRAIARRPGRRAPRQQPVSAVRGKPITAVQAVLAGCALLAFGVSCYSAAWTKNGTYDEVAHVSTGCSFWRMGDFRMAPEAVLAQRWLSLPVYLGPFETPALDHPAWRQAADWQFADEFVYQGDNDADAIFRRARAMNVILGIALGVVVWRWSASLFGEPGGLVSLGLFAFSPTMLAHAGLATIDVAAGLGFTACSWTLWGILHRVTPWRVLASALLLGGFFVTKFSVVVMVPIAAALVAVRLLAGGPLEIQFGRFSRQVVNLRGQAAWIVGLISVHAVVAWIVIWAAFSFRFAMFNNALPGNPAPERLIWFELEEGATGAVRQTVEWAIESRLLPEGYLLAFLNTIAGSELRATFLNGHYSETGFVSFFPYCLGVKTPLPLFGLLCLSLLGATYACRHDPRAWVHGQPPRQTQSSRLRCALSVAYALTPLWALLVVYWSFAIGSKINIGHRHILPTYPAMFVLAGGSACWLRRGAKDPRVSLAAGWPSRMLAGSTVAFLSLFIAESLLTWPHYLAYFNVAAGGSANGYKHLVDSSLDWGQDLRALKAWLDENGHQGPASQPVYLAYFGTADPEYYNICATPLPGDLRGRAPLGAVWKPGLYCISATDLQSNFMTGVYGRWTDTNEKIYRELLATVGTFDRTQDDPRAREALIRQHGLEFWRRARANLDMARLARLLAYLRESRPAARINYTIFVFQLSQEDLDRAQFGPPPESGCEPLASRERTFFRRWHMTQVPHDDRPGTCTG